MSNLYILFTDSGGNSDRLSQIEEDATFVQEVKMVGKTPEPYGLASTPNGRFVVTDRNNNLVRQYFYQTLIEDTANSPLTGIALSNPEGIATDKVNNRVYVCDSGNNALRRWDGTSATSSSFVYHSSLTTFVGTTPTSFNTLSFCEVGSNGDIYITDQGNARVIVFDQDFNFLREWESGGSLAGFTSLTGITVDESDNVYISTNSKIIQKYRSDGTFVAELDLGGNAGNLIGIGVGNGYLYAVDSSDHDIERIDVSVDTVLTRANDANWPVETVNGDSVTTPNDVLFFDEATACVFPDTMILMADETEKAVQDVRSGDMVLDRNRKPVKVMNMLAFDYFGKKPIVEIAPDTFMKGVPNKTLFLSRSHEIAVKSDDELKRARSFKNVGTKHHKKYPVDTLYNLMFERTEMNKDNDERNNLPTFIANNLIVSGVLPGSKYKWEFKATDKK